MNLTETVAREANLSTYGVDLYDWSTKIKAYCGRDDTQTLEWLNSWQYKGSLNGDESRTGMYKRWAETVETDRALTTTDTCGKP